MAFDAGARFTAAIWATVKLTVFENSVSLTAPLAVV